MVDVESSKNNGKVKNHENDEIKNSSGVVQTRQTSSEIFPNPKNNQSFDKKYSKEKAPMVSFDESSLRKSNIDESIEKLSNPFDIEKSNRE